MRVVALAVLLEQVFDLGDYVHLHHTVLVGHVDAQERRDRSPVGDAVLFRQHALELGNARLVTARDDQVVDLARDENVAGLGHLVEQAAVRRGLRVVELVHEEMRERLVPELRSIS